MCGPPLCSIHPLCVKNPKKGGVYWNVYVMDATEERAYEHYVHGYLVRPKFISNG